MNRLSNWLYKVSKGWMVILYLLITLAFMAAVLPGQAENAARYSGGAGSPDRMGAGPYRGGRGERPPLGLPGFSADGD